MTTHFGIDRLLADIRARLPLEPGHQEVGVRLPRPAAWICHETPPRPAGRTHHCCRRRVAQHTCVTISNKCKMKQTKQVPPQGGPPPS